MSNPKVREIKIKTGVVKRISKEKLTYEKEVEVEKQRLVKFTEEEKEDAVLKRQGEVINETAMMVPDCQKRLQTAWNELKEALEWAGDLEETDDYKAARAALKEAEAHLP